MQLNDAKLMDQTKVPVCGNWFPQQAN